MIRRRELLKSAAMMAAGRSLFAVDGARIHFGCQTNAWTIAPRDFSSVLAVIQKIKEYGYEGFETGFANVESQFDRGADARRKLDATGLRFFGVHIFLNQYDPETLVAPASVYERVATGGAKLGAERLILSGAPASDAAAQRRKADALDRAGAFAAKLGMKLAYHTHGPEALHNGAEIDALVRGTDPAKVWILMDAGHAFEVGADVPSLVRRYHTRLTGLHLRDFKNGAQVPLGSGGFPLHAVVETIRQTGWSGWVLNEEERLTSKPGDAAVKPARDVMFRAFGR